MYGIRPQCKSVCLADCLSGMFECCKHWGILAKFLEISGYFGKDAEAGSLQNQSIKFGNKICPHK